LLGEFDHEIILDKAYIYDARISGIITDTVLGIKLHIAGRAVNGDATILYNTTSVQNETNIPIIDLAEQSGWVDIKGHTGSLRFQNSSAVSPLPPDYGVFIDMLSGTVIFDASITHGTYTVTGVCDIIDNSTGTAVVIADNIVNPNKITTTVWSHTQ
jgi:hypothetical protein